MYIINAKFNYKILVPVWHFGIKIKWNILYTGALRGVKADQSGIHTNIIA